MHLEFEIEWDKQLSRSLRLTWIAISNFKPFFKDAVWIMHEKSDEIFKKKWKNVEKNPKWKKLSKWTIRARSERSGYYRKSPNNPSTLRRTWNLQNSWKETVTERLGALEYTAKYAKYHQKWWKHLPRRAIIDLDNKTNTKIIKSFQKHINEKIKIFNKQV